MFEYIKVVIFMFVLLFVVSGTATAFDFKGIEVGENSSAERIHAALNIECEKWDDGRTVCGGATTIGGAFAYATSVVISPKGKVTRIALSVESKDFEKIVSVAIGKYGTPTETTNEKLQNKMGANFQNTTHIWQGDNGNYVKMIKYNGKVDEGLIYYGTAEDTELLQRIHGPQKGDI